MRHPVIIEFTTLTVCVCVRHGNKTTVMESHTTSKPLPWFETYSSVKRNSMFTRWAMIILGSSWFFPIWLQQRHLHQPKQWLSVWLIDINTKLWLHYGSFPCNISGLSTIQCLHNFTASIFHLYTYLFFSPLPSRFNWHHFLFLLLHSFHLKIQLTFSPSSSSISSSFATNFLTSLPPLPLSTLP